MTVTITVTKNGPFVITPRTPLSLTNARGETRVIASDESPVALCRCGQSANKPYCDGTHSTIGFTDAE